MWSSKLPSNQQEKEKDIAKKNEKSRVHEAEVKARAEYKEKKIIPKLRKFAKLAGGGIFTPKSRKMIVGLKSISGRDRTKADFWFDQRKRVENALKDLEIFIELSGEDNIKQVLTSKTLEPIIRALLSRPVWENAKPDLNRAEIARILINISFVYLMAMQKKHITRSHKRTIDDALDLSNYLIQFFRPEGDSNYISPMDLPTR